MSYISSTTEEFIKKAIAKHGPVYDYSKSVYVSSTDKICITCREHGDFHQIVAKHLAGGDCILCARKRVSEERRSNTEEFIKKAVAKHGPVYDYSKTAYVNAKTRVLIICKRHGEFMQLPSNHLREAGCILCGQERMAEENRSNLEEFIKKAVAKHGNFYDYSNVDYKGSGIKVKIGCPRHGDFLQTPSSHLSISGCPQCGKIDSTNKKRLTTDIFKERSNVTFGEGTYDYSKVNYIDAETKVCIVCKRHGEFLQYPHAHMKGQEGCKKCRDEKQKTSVNDFVKRANNKHGEGRYDYSKVIIKEGIKKDKVCIICTIPSHGEFWQNASLHIDGANCPICYRIAQANHRRSTTEEFIKKATDVHGDIYDYSDVNYVNSNIRVNIICRTHGSFFQMPSSHLTKESGCPNCKTFKGERAIVKWLMENNIEYKTQHSFPDLERFNNKPLRFDFYIPNKNLLIEYDGPHHFRPVTFGGISMERATDLFIRDQHYDSVKNQYCIKNNIPLLRIHYKDRKNIPEILTEKILGTSLINGIVYSRAPAKDVSTEVIRETINV